MTQDIFSDDSQQNSENQELTLEQKIAKQLSEIKREDGSQMFDSVEKALESLAHAQRIIPELKNNLKAKEEEVASLSSSLEKAATVEDVISRISNSKQDTNANPRVDSVDEDTIGKLVKEQINSYRQAEIVEANRKQVNEALIAKFGDAEKASLALEAKAKELGVGKEFLASMADKSPKALMAYFSNAAGAASNPTTSSVNIRKGDEGRNPNEIPEFSLSTTSSRDQLEIMKKIKEQVFKKYEVVV